MRIIIDPPILAVIYIQDFNGDFPDFTKDSTEILGFQRRFHGYHERFHGDFRVSFQERFQAKCTRFLYVADPSGPRILAGQNLGHRD